MYKINEDNSIYVTRGDAVVIPVEAKNYKTGAPYTFMPGDLVRIKVYKKKKASEVALQKDFPVTEVTQQVQLFLSGEDTKIGGVISKPVDYWYEVELNPLSDPQTIIGYDEDGAKVFKLFPEGADKEVTEYEPGEEELLNRYLDDELDVTSKRPIENQAVAREMLQLEKSFEKAHEAVAAIHVTPQMYGAIGDGVADDTEALQKMFDTGRRVYIPAGNYRVTRPLTARNSIYGATGAKIYYYPASTDTYKACITIKGDKTKLCENVSCVIGDYSIYVEGQDFSSSVKQGDYIFIESTEKASAYARDYDLKQDMLEVESVSDGTITFTTNPEWSEMGTITLYRMNFIEDIEVANLNIECMSFVMCTSGVQITHAQNPSVRNCHIFNFDYGQIDIRMSINAHAHDNCCGVNYPNELQYGIIYSSVYNGTIHGNTVNSERTAIDISYGSQYVTVTGNSTRGNINTHWALKCLIDGNAINNGFVLIRGKKITVSNNYINTTNLTKSVSCIDISEGGKEGGHVISGNTCIGIITLTAVTSGCRIINNTFKATHCPIYSDTESSMCRIGTAPESLTDDTGCEISGNLFEYIGEDGVKYGIDMYYGTADAEYNIRISNNVIRNADTGIDARLRGQGAGKNMTISGNDIQNAKVGIAFRGMNNTVIANNNIKAKEGGTYGIHRASSNINTSGLVITGNLIDGFAEGLRIYDGQGVIADTVIGNNVYVNCTTKRTVSGAKAKPQAIEYPCIEDSTGTRYKMVVSNGAISLEQENAL